MISTATEPMGSSKTPRVGMLAKVRNRRGVVASVEPFDGAGEGRLHLVRIEYTDSDGIAEDTILWEREESTDLLEPHSLPRVDAEPRMDPAELDALVRATRWGALRPFLDPDGSGKRSEFSASSPFFGAVQVDDFQLVPLLQALRMPRVSILLADDVGLGKTVEAGLVLTELLLRRRIRRVLVLTPASLRQQWQEEMKSKFALSFDLIDRQETHQLQKRLGLDANPWRVFPRIIASYHYLRQPDILQQFLATCRSDGTGPVRAQLPWDLLVVDEAHNLMPSSFGRDSQLVGMLRTISPFFEHKLFLTATPHNGHTRSFSGLLELLDPVRFTQTSEFKPDERRRVEEVVVRRLKSEINEVDQQAGRTPRFAFRTPSPVPLYFGREERILSAAVLEFRKAVKSLIASASKAEQLAGSFAIEILTKRLLSGPYTFAESWHRFKAGATGETIADPSLVSAAKNAAEEDLEDDQEMESRAQHAAQTVGAWMRPMLETLKVEIRHVDQALDALGLNRPGAVPQPNALTGLLDTVLEDLLKLDSQYWHKGPSVPSTWSHRAVTGEIVKPRRVWEPPEGVPLPVFTSDTRRLGVHSGRRDVARVVDWLRRSFRKIALLTNGHQWRLIYAGLDTEAWCEWDIDFWFEEGAPSGQVLALLCLLRPEALTPKAATKAGESGAPLIQAIDATRRGQAELTAALGERVREAVEFLIQASAEVLKLLGGDGQKDVQPRDVYIAATRMVMRCVVILFAEARDLLPRDNRIYYDSYSLQGLREQLDRLAGGRSKDRLRHLYAAWPRLISLFRVVYFGSPHEAMPVTRYAGGLFQPGDPASEDPVSRAIAAFENSRNTPSDYWIHRILELLTRSRVKVRQGVRTMEVETPIDFSDLSSEYIGILYESLLDYQLRQAPHNEPIVFLSLGDQPALPFMRLQAISSDTLAKMFEKFKQKAQKSLSEAEESEEEVEGEETEVEEAAEGEQQDAEVEAQAGEASEAEREVLDTELEDRVLNWARQAVVDAKIVKKPRGKLDQRKQKEYDDSLNQAAQQLYTRVVRPGDWYLVREGATRKGSGTFYTRPQLASPITRRALQPLLYDGDAPRTPEQILALRICDPAMGSGSFLISALRYREEAYSVMESLRLGAADVLDMEPEDLLVLVIGKAGVNTVDAMLYDPMPGGSGLLDQMVERWGDVVRAAISIAEDCPSLCAAACVDCLMTFRNSFYHAHLNRNTAADRMRQWSATLTFSNDIPQRLPSQPASEMTVNDAEERLRLMLERAGLHGYQPQQQIDLGLPLGSTTPDFYYPPATEHYEGICVYLDGMSRELHGNPERQKRDRRIREELRNRGYEVVEIAHGQLFDRDAMAQHFFRIGRLLLGKDSARRVKEDLAWFGD